jgi:16S rRNA (cytosine1402-N4)-methyltransferase
VTHAGKNSTEKKLRSPMAKLPDPDPKGIPHIHIPVLLDEAVQLLAPIDGGIYLDGSGRVIGFEWDAKALNLAREKLSAFGKRFIALHKNYTEIMEGLRETGIDKADGLLLDLGVSSLQFDDRTRGFSFQEEGPLDMRMDRRYKLTADELINSYSKDQLADIFYYYGEERQARRIASHIVEERARKRITTTSQLAKIIANAVPRKFHPRKIHVATRVFQALRIAVNKELDNLNTILDLIPEILKPGGKVCIITFHSLEDRLVKRKLKDNPQLQVLTKKPVTPGPEEIKTNPRSRSAKLRAAYMKG